MEMREMIEMHAALLAVMVGLDVIWTKAVWPDTGGAYEMLSGLMPIMRLTLLITLLMIHIPGASTYGVMAGAIIGFGALGTLDICRILKRNNR